MESEAIMCTKKKLRKISILILLLIFLAGCGKNGNNEVKTIRVSHVLTEDHPTNLTLLNVFKKEVEEKSNGRLKVEIYPNGQLGSDRQAIESVSIGTLDMSVPGGPVLSGFYEPFMVYDLPYLFDTKDEAYRACDGPLKDKLSKELMEKSNIRILGIGENGFRHITTTNRKITKLEDLKGLKIRTMESPLHMATFKALGANPTPIAFNELFTALQQGTVDGQENPITIIHDSRLYEVQKYMVLDQHYYVNCPYIISEKCWESLSEEDQKIVQDATTKTVNAQRKMLNELEKKYLDTLKEGGIEVVELSEQEKQKFKDATKSVYDIYTNRFGEENVKLAKESK